MNLVRKTNLILLGLILGLLCLEIAFGRWFSPDALRSLNILRNIKYSLDISELYQAPYSTITYTRDKFGLRGRYIHPDQISLLTVGGSTTDQRYIGDGFTWQDHLAARYKSAGKTRQIANAGVDGHSTIGHLASLEKWFPKVPRLAPRFILFYIGLNDIANINSTGNKFDNLSIFESELDDFLESRSALFSLHRTLMGMYYARRYRLGHAPLNWKAYTFIEVPAEIQNSTSMPDNGVIEAYGSRVKKLIALTRGLGALPILVTQRTMEFEFASGKLLIATRGDVQSESLLQSIQEYRRLEALNKETCRVAEDEKIPCFDLATELKFSQSDFYDFLHNTPTGAQRIGDYFFERLKEII